MISPDHSSLSFLIRPFLAEAEDASSLGASHDHVQAMDAAAYTMIVLLFFLLGCVLYAVWRLNRHSRNSSALDGLDNPPSPKDQGDAPKKATPWEKDPDWWKK